MKGFIYPLTLLAVLTGACQQPVAQQQQGQKQENSSAAQVEPLPPLAPAGPLLSDSSTFPFVYQGLGRSNHFEAYSTRFDLSYTDPWKPLLNESLPWMKPQDFNINNGVYITYVREGRPVDLSNPYVMVQYLGRKLPYCSSVDSVYYWMDQAHVEGSRGSVFRDSFTIPTASGKMAICKEYKSGNANNRTPKWLAYAYIEYNSEYIIGLALTTTLESDFVLSKEGFYSIVKSFR